MRRNNPVYPISNLHTISITIGDEFLQAMPLILSYGLHSISHARNHSAMLINETEKSYPSITSVDKKKITPLIYKSTEHVPFLTPRREEHGTAFCTYHMLGNSSDKITRVVMLEIIGFYLLTVT